jgi:hypothetical protein
MREEQVPNVDYAWIEGKIGEDSRDIRDGMKFVLAEAEDGRTFVRFREWFINHPEIDNQFMMELLNSSDPARELRFSPRTGGKVDLRGYTPGKQEDKYELFFHGTSEKLGPFDRDLLRRTLDANPHPRFSYQIE